MLKTDRDPQHPHARLNRGHRLAPPSARWPLDLGLLRLSSRDWFMLQDAFSATHIFGGLGSGKTTGSGQSLAHAYLRAGFGGVVLCAKASERATWERYAAQTGRTKDLVFFGPGCGNGFNLIDYEMNRKSEGAGNIDNIAKILEEALETTTANQVAGGDPFWREARGEMIRHMLQLEKLTGRPISWINIMRNIHSLPRSMGEYRDPRWRQSSEFHRSLRLATERLKAGTNDDGQLMDLWLTAQYVHNIYAPLDPEPRSGIVSMVSALADRLQRSPMRDLILSKTTVEPEATEEGKIIILAMDVSTHDRSGQFVQVLFKNAFQRMILRRRHTHTASCRPLFLWADEAHFFTSEFDHKFQTTAREFRAATVYLSQNLQNYYAAMGDGSPARAKSLLSAFGNTIFHANSDPETNKYAEELAGVHEVRRPNASESWSHSSSGWNSSGRSHSVSNGWSEQVEPYLRHADISMLSRGGRHCYTDAIMFRSGKPFYSTGRSMIRLRFPQQVRYIAPHRQRTSE